MSKETRTITEVDVQRVQALKTSPQNFVILPGAVLGQILSFLKKESYEKVESQIKSLDNNAMSFEAIMDLWDKIPNPKDEGKVELKPAKKEEKKEKKVTNKKKSK